MGKHARLSASTAHRWMVCPGSVALSEKVGEPGGSSFYAREGSAAHAFGEWLVTNDRAFEGGVDPDDYIGEGVVYETGSDDFHFSPDGSPPPGVAGEEVVHEWEVDADMADAVRVYLDTVRALRADMDPDVDTEYVETYLDMSWLHPDMGGTGDHILVRAFKSIDVTDYKHGRGVVVEVEGNEQMLKYAVGARRLHPEADEVTVRVVQPRAAHPDGPVREYTYTRGELDEFEGRLREAGEATGRPNAPLRAGTHCRFCPALGACPEARAEAERQAAADFSEDPDEYEPDDVKPLGREALAESLRWVDFLDAWCRAVEGEALLRLRAGESVPGHKLVRKGTQRRVVVDEATAIRRLRKAGLKKADCLTTPKLKTPAQLEKLGSDRGLTAKIVAEISEKPEGDTTIARDEDPRPAVDPVALAAADFEDEEDDD